MSFWYEEVERPDGSIAVQALPEGAYPYPQGTGGGRWQIETFAGPYRVSTVFLGLDHSHGDGPPLLYETMVFTSDSWDEVDGKRYTARVEAIEGHDEIVKKYKTDLEYLANLEEK